MASDASGESREPYDALVVVSFGGPEGPDDVLPFLENVTRGRGIPRERLLEVAATYQRFGGVSPINAQNRALVTAVTTELAASGIELPVYLGNRHWHPFLAGAVAQMARDGVRRALAFVTSAYSSYSGCRAYLEEIDRARETVGPSAPRIEKLRAFWNHPGFVEPMAENVRRALGDIPAGSRRAATRLIFTGHSIPIASAESCDYVAQLRETGGLIVERLEPPVSSDLVFQSRSGPPTQPWLGPDVGDHLEDLARQGVRAAVVAPIGFVSDHMEVVYDLDTVARERASAAGIAMVRAATVGVAPAFVGMVRELVQERLDPRVPRRFLGTSGTRADVCSPGCCPAPRRPERVAASDALR
jgi:ferrochelatase